MKSIMLAAQASGPTTLPAGDKLKYLILAPVIALVLYVAWLVVWHFLKPHADKWIRKIFGGRS